MDKYKEALNKAKKLMETSVAFDRFTIEHIFPELKESEDEKIRKALIENFKWFCGDYPETTKLGKDDNLLVKDIIAWLEKQGEKKHSWGESENAYLDFTQSAIEFCYGENNPLRKELVTWLNSFKEKYQGKDIKVEPKFKDGDVLYSPTHHLIWIYKDNDHYHACINMNYAKYVTIDGLIRIPKDACPATKEQRKQLKKAMVYAGYTFDFEKKELKELVEQLKEK